MTDREVLIGFTKGVLQKLRDFASIPDEAPIRVAYNAWQFQYPGVVLSFKVFPNERLHVLSGKKWVYIGRFKIDSDCIVEKVREFLAS